MGGKMSWILGKQVNGREVNAYQIVIVFIVQKVLLAKQGAEGGVTQSLSFVRAELKHSNCISSCEVHAGDLAKICQQKSLVLRFTDGSYL